MRLRAHQLQYFPPAAQKTIRDFRLAEAAKLIGIHEGYLRQLVAEGKGPQPDTTPNDRRSYSIEDIQMPSRLNSIVAAKARDGIFRIGESGETFASYFGR